MRLPVRVRRQAEFVLAKFCRERIPRAMSAQVRLEYDVHGLTAVLVEPLPSVRSTPFAARFARS